MAGSDGVVVSRATEEREHLAISKNCKVWRVRAQDLKF
jgi:hypothetical protein